MKKLLKQLFCKHEYCTREVINQEPIYKTDADDALLVSFNMKGGITCFCPKCGKEHKRYSKMLVKIVAGDYVRMMNDFVKTTEHQIDGVVTIKPMKYTLPDEITFDGITLGWVIRKKHDKEAYWGYSVEVQSCRWFKGVINAIIFSQKKIALENMKQFDIENAEVVKIEIKDAGVENETN